MSIKVGDVPPYVVARRLLRWFVDSVDRGEQPDEAVMQPLADSFRAILDDETPELPIHLVKSRGRQPKTDERTRLEIHGVIRVLQLLDENIGPDKAFTIVGAEVNKDRRTVRGWYDDRGIYAAAKGWHDLSNDPRFQELIERRRREETGNK